MVFLRQALRGGVSGLLAVSMLAASSLALVACGGGGGGGGSGPKDGSSGLMPVAPTPGVVLAADATTLRPLRDGAKWRYHGIDQPVPNSLPTAFDNERTTLSRAGGGFSEADTNAYGEGADTVTVVHRGGSVLRTESLALSPLMPAETLEFTELRSPVRQDDQYPVLDRRLRGVVPDADGDGTAEDIDIAAYRRVAREETVTLGALGSRRAVRVDFITLARARLSRDGRVGPVVTVTQQEWYEAGVGVVKRVLARPNATQLQTITEELVSHDAIDQGLGVLPAVALRAPPQQPGWADVPLSHPHTAMRLGDRVAIVARLASGNGTGSSSASVLMTADLSGTLRSVWRADAPTQTIIDNSTARWTSDGSRLLLVHYHWPNTGPVGWSVTAFDADVQLQGAAGGSPLQLPPAGPAGGTHTVLALAADAGRFWALWLALPTGEATHRLMLGAFGADGRAIGPALLLDSTGPGSSLLGLLSPSFDESARLAAGPGGVLATWRRNNSLPGGGFDSEFRYGWVPSTSTPPVVRTLATDPRGERTPELLPAVAGTRGVLAWRHRFGSPGAPGMQAVRLDAAGLPLFSGTHTAFSTPFEDTRRGCEATASFYTLVADEAGAVLSTVAQCTLWFDDYFSGNSSPRRPVRHLMIDDSATPLADGLASMPMFTRHGADAGGLPLLFGPRMLLVVPNSGFTPGPIRFTTVWRR